MTSLDQTALTKLRFRLRGALYEPDQPEYAEACTLFNAMIERRPRLVARCAAPDDVVAAVAFTREHGLAIAVRARGHSVAGLSLVDGGLVIDVRGMSDIEVDPSGRSRAWAPARPGRSSTGPPRLTVSPPPAVACPAPAWRVSP